MDNSNVYYILNLEIENHNIQYKIKEKIKEIINNFNLLDFINEDKEKIFKHIVMMSAIRWKFFKYNNSFDAVEIGMKNFMNIQTSKLRKEIDSVQIYIEKIIKKSWNDENWTDNDAVEIKNLGELKAILINRLSLIAKNDDKAYKMRNYPQATSIAFERAIKEFINSVRTSIYEEYEDMQQEMASHVQNIWDEYKKEKKV